jgi:hypothetical protein
MVLTHIDVLKLDHPDGDYPPCSECGQWDGTVWRHKTNMLFGADPNTGRDRPVDESGEQAMLQFLLEHPDERRGEMWRLVCPGCRDERVAARLARLNKGTPGAKAATLSPSAVYFKVLEEYGGACFLCGDTEDLQIRPDSSGFWDSLGLPRRPGSDQRTKRVRRLLEMGCPKGYIRVWCRAHANQYWSKTNSPEKFDGLKRLVDSTKDDPDAGFWLR